MLDRLNALYPVRYTALGLCVVLALLSLFTLIAFGIGGFWFLVFAGLSVLGVFDLRQTKSSVLRNYPVIGHLRFMLEKIRPEIRQYFLESDNEATPFSRSQRSLAYARAKGETDKRPFGTQVDQNATGHEWLNHSMAPSLIASHDFRTHHRRAGLHAALRGQRVQHLGHELWRALGQRDPGAQRGRQTRRLRARHRRRFDLGLPPAARRRPDLGNRLGLLRLPRRRRPLQPRALQGQRDWTRR